MSTKFPSRSLKVAASIAEEWSSKDEAGSKNMATMIKEAFEELDLRAAVLLGGGTTIVCLAAWTISLASIWIRR